MLHQQLESKLTTPILPTDELNQKENLTLKSENFFFRSFSITAGIFQSIQMIFQQPSVEV